MKNLRFNKTIKRNDFTIVFGTVGKRRFIKDFVNKVKRVKVRFKMQQIRRAHQGWRNKVIGSLQALRVRLKYGRRKPVPQFRR
jgi:hypothetical protein